MNGRERRYISDFIQQINKSVIGLSRCVCRYPSPPRCRATDQTTSYSLGNGGACRRTLTYDKFRSRIGLIAQRRATCVLTRQYLVSSHQEKPPRYEQLISTSVRIRLSVASHFSSISCLTTTKVHIPCLVPHIGSSQIFLKLFQSLPRFCLQFASTSVIYVTNSRAES